MTNAFIQDIDLFDPVMPFQTGWLEQQQHRIYFEQCGNADGIPVLFLHGGPGAGISPVHRRLFNPNKFRTVLFDQRGSGRSTPLGATADNTTLHLIEDIETLRKQLGIDQFLLFGGSWGSTLALAYAIAYPEHVQGLILRGIFLGSDAEVNWFLYEMGRFFPEAHARFVNFLPQNERNNLLENYYHRLMSDDNMVHQPAANSWSSYETSCSTLRAEQRYVSGKSALTMARLEAHYFMNGCFMPDGHIMNHIKLVHHLPIDIIQGRHDVICPPMTAASLAHRWGKMAKLQLVDNAGHSTFESGIAQALLSALDAYI
ncbi:prolyl aminopeptidase [Candidatus Puniceispirillum sp.]|uniref:prolyl aminopeptidase n=1 Tax=Candidatus Puniceispirillum sp. TaxID=2026719 RepID=UPI003F6A293B